MSDVETSDSDEEFDSEDVIVIKSFAAQNGKGENPRSEAGNSSLTGPSARFKLGQSDELDTLMESLTGRIEEYQEELKAGVRAHIIAWLQRVAKAPSALNSRKLPVCWVHSGTIHSIEVNQALWDMLQTVRRDAGSAVILTPDDMGVPKASNKLAKMMCNQLSDVSLPPGSHCTLQHVAAQCAKNMLKASKPGSTQDTTAAPELLVVLPDIDITAQRPLQQLMHALSDLRQEGALRPAIVVGAARHPQALRPLLSAEGARAHAYMRPEPYKLPSSLASLGSLVKRTQVNLELPEVALGPHVLTCLARIVSRTGLCQGTHLLSQTLRLMLLRHFWRNPTAAIGAAVRDGDWAVVKQRVKALPPALEERLAAEAAELWGDSEAAQKVDERPSRMSKKAKKESPQRQRVVMALKSLRQAVLSWQLALQWLHLAADATLRASTLKAKPAEELAWWPLVVGASTPGYMKPGTTPGLGPESCTAAQRGALWPANLRSGQAQQRAACFGDSATARATKQCYSAVAQLQGGAVAELAREVERVARSCGEAADGALSPHVEAIAALVAAGEAANVPGEQDLAGESGEEWEGAEQGARGGIGRADGRTLDAARPRTRRNSAVVACDTIRGANDRDSQRDSGDGEGEDEIASGFDSPDSAENENGNENGPAAQRAGNGGVSPQPMRGRKGTGRGRHPETRKARCRGARSLGAEERQPRGTRATRRNSTAAAAEPTLRDASEGRAALAPVAAGALGDEYASDVAVAGPRPKPAARRGHRQTNGQFLVQEAERAAARVQGSAEGDGDGGAVMAAGVRDSAAAQLAHILHDAWLTALQVHPSQHPCASVLFVDDGDYAVQTLAPSPRDDLHQVLMDPIKYLRLKRGVAPPVALTFTCTAYQLLTAYGRNVDVGDWFASFCLALGAPPGAGADSAGGRGKKKRRAPKKKRKMKTVERSVHGAAEDAAAEEDQPADGPEQCVIDLEGAGDDMHNLYVYFYHAVKHLMYYGVLKRCNRRTGGFWKREIFPPDGRMVFS